MDIHHPSIWNPNLVNETFASLSFDTQEEYPIDSLISVDEFLQKHVDF
jgi:hypothetical protein